MVSQRNRFSLVSALVPRLIPIRITWREPILGETRTSVSASLYHLRLPYAHATHFTAIHNPH